MINDVSPPAPMNDSKPSIRRKRRRLPPLMIRAPGAARLCGVSEASWHRLNAAALVPAPRRLGGCVLWSRPELRDWIAAGCPNREAWETIRAGRQQSRQ
jgi:predicted DNA-binding transcriptional regulator AlpA